MKIVTSNGKRFLQITKNEWLSLGLKFEEARKKKKGLGRGPCGRGMARGKKGQGGGKGGAGPGYGKGNATGPRAQMGTCPKQK